MIRKVDVLRNTPTGWQLHKETWENILQNMRANITQVIFTSAALLLEDSLKARNNIVEQFRMPSCLFDKVYLESNGFSGCDFKFSKDGKVESYGCWSRFVVKQTFERLSHKPTFTRHSSTCSTHISSQKSNIALHDPETAQYGWRWYEMGFFCYWQSSGSVTFLCFDLPVDVQTSVSSSFSLHNLNDLSPYSMMLTVMDEIIRLYDDSVWSLRNHICNWEAKRPRQADYLHLHEMARHGIHISETLSVAVESVSALCQQHKHFQAVAQRSPKTDELQKWDAVENQIQFHLRFLKSLLQRSDANNARIQNEITLAFNAAAQRDSQIQVQIGEEAKRETAAMKAIAIVTLTFLPATFVSSLFGMCFFSFNPGSETTQSSFVTSAKFWIYWAIAVPLTIATLVSWKIWSYWIRRCTKSDPPYTTYN